MPASINSTEIRAFPTGWSLGTGQAAVAVSQQKVDQLIGKDLALKPKTSNKICILVLGMHRSGTSALTGLINRLGVALPETEIMPGDPTNASGHFEPTVIVELHDRLLAALGSSWADPREITAAELHNDVALDTQRELHAHLEKWFSHTDVLVLKDPRMCRLLPMWRNLLDSSGIRSVATLIYRNPLSVSDSLAARNGFLPIASLCIWLRHLLDAEAGTRGTHRSFVRYENLLADWPTEVKRLSAQTGLELEAAIDASERFIDHSASHHIHMDDELEAIGAVPEMTRELIVRVMAAHERLALDPENRKTLNALDELRAAFDRLCREVSPLIFSHTHAMNITEGEVRRLERQVQAFENSLSWRITAPLRKIRRLGLIPTRRSGDSLGLSKSAGE